MSGSVRLGLVLVFLLLVFCFRPSLDAVKDSILTRSSTRVLVLVIAGGSKLQYEFYRVYWKLMAAQARRFNIQVYLLSFGKEPRMTSDTLSFVGEDSLVPGCLNLTTLALRTIVEQGLPGSNFAALVRTNLSTFWDFRRLLFWLERIGFFSPEPLYGGPRLYLRRVELYVTGSAILMNRACAQLFWKSPIGLDYSLPDDVSISKFLRKNHGVEPQPRNLWEFGGPYRTQEMTGCWLDQVWEKPLAAKVLVNNTVHLSRHCNESVYWRIKTESPLLDLRLWNHLLYKNS